MIPLLPVAAWPAALALAGAPAVAPSSADSAAELPARTSIEVGVALEPAPAAPGASSLAVFPRVEEQDQGWQFILSPYLWAVGLSGDLDVAGSQVPIDLAFGDILDDFNGGGSLFFEARKDRWSLLADVTYITLKATEEVMPGVNADTDTSIGLLGLDAAYQVGEQSAWDALLGVRHFDLDNDIAVTGNPPVSGGMTSTQGVVGVRGRWRAGSSWEFRVRGDLGVGSDSSWQLLGIAGYEFGKHWGLSAGYRALGMDVDDGGAKLDATIHGLLLGLVFAW
jgi:hypothetical protein